MLLHIDVSDFMMNSPSAHHFVSSCFNSNLEVSVSLWLSCQVMKMRKSKLPGQREVLVLSSIIPVNHFDSCSINIIILTRKQSTEYL